MYTVDIFIMILGDVQYQHLQIDETGEAADQGTQTSAVVELPLNPGLSDPKSRTWQQALLSCKYSSSFPMTVIVKVELTWS